MIWLDGLYFRHQQDSSSFTSATSPANAAPGEPILHMMYVGTSERLWMTHVTVQDEEYGGYDNSNGIEVGGKLYAEGVACSFLLRTTYRNDQNATSLTV
jgi:hypothetical protein